MEYFLGRARWRLSLLALTLCAILGSSCIQSNSQPVIDSLAYQEARVMLSDSCEVRCVAYDADDDSLTYTWSATGGTFSGTGPVVTWIAPPTPGTYAITVKVTDGRGGEATHQITIDVLVNQPPMIESLTAEASAVRQAESTHIECVAHDLDGDVLSYQWTATGGNISGEGAYVTWTAPNTCGNYIITVTVADGRGGEASKSSKIEVKKPG